MINKEEYPSYGNLIKEGRTTLPEKFFDCPDWYLSLNHHFMGDVANWYMSAVAGLKVKDSTHIEISPNFIERLTFAEAYYDLPSGRTEVKWERNGDKISLFVKCPVDCDIIVPDEVEVIRS